MNLGEAYLYSEADSCYYYANQGLKLAQKLEDRKEESLCLSLLGRTLCMTGNLAQGLDYSLKSLHLAERLGEPNTIFNAFNTLGGTYFAQNDFRKALEYYFRSLTLAQRIKDEYYILNARENIGDVYSRLNVFDSVFYFTDLAFRKSKEIKDTSGMVDEVNNLGDVYAKLNEDSLALGYYQLALRYEFGMDEMDETCGTLLGLAGIFKKQNKEDSALIYGYRSMNLAVASKFSGLQMEASKFLASIYEAQKNTDSAFKYLKLTLSLKDSLFTEEKSKSLQNMTFEENIHQQELANQKNRAEEDATKNLELLAIGVFIPIFFLFVLFLSRIKVKARFVEFLGILSLLMFFEFITDLLYPFVNSLTNESPVWEMLILVIIAALLEPLNYRMEKWVKTRLVHTHDHAPKPVMPEAISYDDE
jgi:tetratricopeptide (TPR) repeat protein